MSVKPDVFRGEFTNTEGLLGDVQIPAMNTSRPKRLGHFLFWLGEERFLDVIQPIYASASPIGMNVFIGEPRAGPQYIFAPGKTQAEIPQAETTLVHKIFLIDMSISSDYFIHAIQLRELP